MSPDSAHGALRDAAETLLRANDADGYTVPSRLTYPHQWNWDSALSALGWAEIDPARAWTELETLAAARDERGMVPHIAFRSHLPDLFGDRLRRLVTKVARLGPRYAPGPRWWGPLRGADGRRISGITQPPVAATSMRLLFERDPDERRARPLLEAFNAWHRFLLEKRDPLGLGEPILIHPWESGRDNSVEWDAPLWRVRPEVAVLHRLDLDSVDATERPSDEHYRRYLTLVRGGCLSAWPQERLAHHGPFRVLDPGFSAIFARASIDLAWLAAELGEEALADESRAAGERVADAMRSRADSDGLIRAVDLADGSTLPETSAGSALALLTPGLPERAVDAAAELVAEGGLASPFGVRSLEGGHPQLDSRNYWRGPVWANVTWLAAHALSTYDRHDVAAELRGRMLRSAERGGLREYFAPDSGRGLGARDFSWTAALALRELGADRIGARLGVTTA